jgi:phosphoribosyl-dephospho-CoA transferase
MFAMNKIVIPLIAVVLTACGPAKPTETVDELVANPARIKEIQRLCKEDRAKVGDELCMRAAAAYADQILPSRPNASITGTNG